jgi:hypothetical protein
MPFCLWPGKLASESSQFGKASTREGSFAVAVQIAMLKNVSMRAKPTAGAESELVL